MTGVSSGGARGDGRRDRHATLAVACTAVIVALLGLQLELVNGAFTTPVGAPQRPLPSSLGPLLSGPGPEIADAPFVRPPSVKAGVPAGGSQWGDVQGWSDSLAPQVGVPAVALAAYGAAQLELSVSDPGCNLSWPTLAGIGYIESDHGRFGGAALTADGHSTPPVVGVALDGRPGVARIADTDGGALDGDPVFDRAVGTMQFLPSTWAAWRTDGDADGVLDPFDLDDAAGAAGRYLCAAGGDLATGAGWTRALYAYNASDRYVLDVRAAADTYAARSTAP